jgi:UDP-2,3-diacylglucosamine pyrophosphatase LpxH
MLGDRAYTALLMCNGVLHRVRQVFGLEYWSLSKYVKGRTKQALNFIYKFEEHLSTYAKNHRYHGVICGHIHTPALKDINGTVYANSGDWVETCSALVETMDGEFQLLVLGDDGTMLVTGTYL